MTYARSQERSFYMQTQQPAISERRYGESGEMERRVLSRLSIYRPRDVSFLGLHNTSRSNCIHFLQAFNDEILQYSRANGGYPYVFITYAKNTQSLKTIGDGTSRIRALHHQ